jgi:hypothetical protein
MPIPLSSDQMAHPISRLRQVQELTDFEPLDKWAADTAAILEEAQQTDAGDERQKLLKSGYEEL